MWWSFFVILSSVNLQVKMEEILFMSFEEKQVEVIIIGAGLSGLMAALTLKKCGKHFVLLEAQSRVGGRLLSTSYKGTIIDLGAQTISPYQKRINQLLAEYGLTINHTHKSGTILYAIRGKKKRGMGKVPPFSVISKLDLIHMEYKLKKLLTKVNTINPWETLNLRDLDSLSMEKWLKKVMFSKFGQDFYRHITEEGVCTDLNNVSLLDVLWEIKSTGTYQHFSTTEDAWITAGAQSLANRMAEDLETALVLNAPVASIHWSQSNVRVFTDKGIWRGKKVIIAIPPILTNKILYEPPLPKSRVVLCNSVCQGSVIKCVIVYDQPFWRDRGESGICYYDTGPVKATMDSSSPGQREGVLTAFVTGNDSEQLSKLSFDDRKKAVLRCLSDLFGKEIMKPVAYFEKDWTEDPWARGGYAGHFKPGALTQFGEALSKPIGPIHWAGSETASEWRLYMEGALEAGERAALEVISDL